ncbi:YciI family protein [Austwickia chelonae]|uniref:YciI family protein n=1 Tax=Austwickia chelonae TaxID=100225 RepID=UPI000E2331E1|nr:YciI family protein [Austwickia chelonae]
MSIYAVHYTYTDDTDTIAEKRPAHRAYLAELVEAGHLLASGPYVGVSEALLIFTAESTEAVESFLAGDPFQKEGLVAAHTVTEWNPLLGVLKDYVS